MDKCPFRDKTCDRFNCQLWIVDKDADDKRKGKCAFQIIGLKMSEELKNR